MLERIRQIMGTERDIVYEGPCKCGEGKFQVYFCNPDHDWPTSTPFWYELSIVCKACKQLYELQIHENHVVVVERSEIFKKKQLAKESEKRWSSLLSTVEVKKILNEFISLIEGQRSIAAIHRLLTTAGLEYSSITTFRKKWSSPQGWIDKNVYHFTLSKIMELVGNNSTGVLQEVLIIEKLYKEAQSNPPFLGEPIYTANDIA